MIRRIHISVTSSVPSGKRLAKKVLLIGWDGADWKVINPLLDSGKMPTLERFINRGVMGNLASLSPPLSPLLWTSIATGMRPFKHGILYFTEPDPYTGGIRLVSSTSRKVKAIWNILNQNGHKLNVIGWWPSHPAEKINGVMVSNYYHKAHAPIGKPWPMQHGTVHPPELTEAIADLRIHPAEITAQQILPFIPKAADIDQQKDSRLSVLTRAIAQCSTIHACATAVMQLEPWDFMAVYYDAIDYFSHSFMKYHPPRQKHISERDFELYQDVIESAYRFHDMMLGTLLKLAGEETTVILISDHGFHPDHLRPTHIPSEPAGPAIEHRPYGIFAMKGPGIKQDELVFGSSLLDIAPTILTLFGLPIGEDMDGKPLVQCFKELPGIQVIHSWEKVEGDTGMHPQNIQINPVEAGEAIRQLVALGYIEDPGEDNDKAVSEAVREARYNLAQAYIDANRHADAIPLLEELWEANPEELRFANRLAHCYLVLQRLPECRRTIEALIKTQIRLTREARQKLKEYVQKHKEAEGKMMTSTKELEEKEKAQIYRRLVREQREIQRLHALAASRKYWFDYLMGCLFYAENKSSSALQHLRRAEKAKPHLPILHLQIGYIYLKLKLWDEADRAFTKAIKIDPDNAQAHLGRCRSLLPRRRTLNAAEEALAAVGLLYHFPEAHYYLGIALHRLGDIDRAIEALQVALSQNPYFIKAHKRLSYIYRFRLKDIEKAEYHKIQANKIHQKLRQRPHIKATIPPSLKDQDNLLPKQTSQIKQKAFTGPLESETITDNSSEMIIIVSGLPRSGTSMMMQMLAAGGYPCLIDGVRQADEDNPHGYFELEKTKVLSSDTSWLPEAKGKAVKIIAQLLPFLPTIHNYKVIFVERDLKEIIKSQNKMLNRQNRQGANLSEESLGQAFTQQIHQVKSMLSNRKIPTLYVSYSDTLENSMDTAIRLKAFVGKDLNIKAMANAVDHNL